MKSVPDAINGPLISITSFSQEQNPIAQGLLSFSNRTPQFRDFLVDSDSKESACNAGDPGLISGLGRSPGEGNGYTLQNLCQYNPMDREAWRATVHGVAKSQTRLSNLTAAAAIQSPELEKYFFKITLGLQKWDLWASSFPRVPFLCTHPDSSRNSS